VINGKHSSELSADARETLERVHRSAWIIVLALAGSIAAYAIIGFVVLRSREQPEQAQLSPTFLVLVVFLTIAPIWIRRTQLAETRLQSIVTTRGLKGLVRHFLVVTIICGAIADSIGVLGLVAALIGGGERYLLVFTAVALLVLLRGYPSKNVWEKALAYFSAKIQRPGEAG
jgi:hypothetical protein